MTQKEDVEGLLDRLGSDPDFREKLLGDPQAALAEHGIQVDPTKIPQVRALPSMQEFKANREAYRSKLMDELGLWPFLLR